MTKRIIRPVTIVSRKASSAGSALLSLTERSYLTTSESAGHCSTTARSGTLLLINLYRSTIVPCAKSSTRHSIMWQFVLQNSLLAHSSKSMKSLQLFYCSCFLLSDFLDFWPTETTLNETGSYPDGKMLNLVSFNPTGESWANTSVTLSCG